MKEVVRRVRLKEELKTYLGKSKKKAIRHHLKPLKLKNFFISNNTKDTIRGKIWNIQAATRLWTIFSESNDLDTTMLSFFKNGILIWTLIKIFFYLS